MKNCPYPDNKPAAIRWIGQAVAGLTMPSLSPLQQTMRDVSEGVAQRRGQLLQEAAAARDEGFAAAARMALCAAGDGHPKRPGYFQRSGERGQS